MLIKPSSIKQFVKDKGNNRRISREYLEKLEAKVKTMICQSMDWPGNKKTLRDLM